MTAKKKNPAEDTSNRELVVMRIFDAPRELVWEAWTDLKHISQWWGPRGFTTTTREQSVKPGGIWKYMMHGPDGTDYPNKIVFTEVVKPERLVYGHGDFDREHFKVTVTFTEESGKTRLIMRMLFPTVEACEATKKFGAVEGGNQTMDRLTEHLAKLVSREFVISRTFNAPREQLWKMWTERDHLMQWFGPKGFKIPVAKVDLRPGGMFHYCMRSSDGHEMWGKFVYREISKPERLIFITSFSDEAGKTTRPPFSQRWPVEILSTVTFKEHDGGTTVTVQSVPFNATDEERKTFEAGHESMQKGWSGTFDKLVEYLAKA